MRNRLWVLGAPDTEMDLIESLLRDAGERFLHAIDRDGNRVTHDNAYDFRPPDPFPWRDEDEAFYEGFNGGTTLYLVECDSERLEGYWTEDEDPYCSRREVIIDHHRPGTPGYGRRPSEFLPASSIGQVIAELAWLGVLERVVTRHAVEPYDPAAWTWCREQDPPPDRRHQHPRAGLYDYRGMLSYGQTWMRSGWVVTIHPHGQAVGPAHSCGSVWIPRAYVTVAALDHCPDAARRGECPGVVPAKIQST